MSTAPTRRAVAAGASALALAMLTACGPIGDLIPGRDPFLDQSTRSMAKASFADMQDVTSMRILGDVETDGYGRMQVDVSVGRNACQGSFDSDDMGGFQLRQNADGTWVRADERFWQTQVDTGNGAQLWKSVRGKWFTSDGKDDYLKLCDLDKILAEFRLEPDDTDESIDDEAVVEVGSSDAVPLTGGRGKKRTTIWVSVDAPHYVLKTAPAEDKGLPDALYFEEFGVKVVVETPADKDILDVPKDRAGA